MKIILLYLFIGTLWISCHGQSNPNPNPNSNPNDSNAAQKNEKIHYESLPIINRISNYGLDNIEDSEDPTVVEFQFLRKRDSYCIGEDVIDPITHVAGGFLGLSSDVCEKDFTSNPFFSTKQIEVAKKAGTTENKPIEITRYDVTDVNFGLHKCACEIKGNPNEESKSYCIDGSVYVTEGVKGSDSFFILKKADTSDNLNLKAQITLSGSSTTPTAPATSTTSNTLENKPLNPPSS